MTFQSSTLLRAYLDILNEASNPNIKVPPVPALPQADGELPGGEVARTNPDGTRSYAGAFGTFTYDKSGKAIKYSSPQFTGVGREVDLTSGDQTTSVNQGPVSVSTTQTPGGYTKQTDAEYDMGMATAGQKTVGPNTAAGQLAGTTTNTVTDKGTGQTKQQVKGVAFGGASGANVGKNYVGSSEDELAQHAANSVTGGKPPATTVKEGPPAGIGPNAAPKSTSQQPNQDMFTKMLPSMGNKMIDQMAGLAPQMQKLLQDFTPGSPYYEKNVKGNPKLEKAAADTLAQAGQFAQDPNALGNYIADIKQRFNQALTTTKGASGTSPEYNKAADELGLPAVKEGSYPNKSLLEHIEEVENDGTLTSGDYFHIELSEDEGIETWVIAEWSDSVLIEADGATLRLLEESGITFQDELTEAEYQGRSVPLGKRMAGDVKKSKVYVKKPNGKVVKVNFGDKNMTIKKSNPARRRSFRARHNCDNPGPRWKARYWSCRAW
jgi:hypothetical protein